jgi:hypothetical protein
MRLFLTTIALGTMMTAPMMAAADFTGTWTLNVAQSQYGQFPAPQSMTRVILMSGSTLTMITNQKGASGEVSTTLKYTLDGKPNENGESKGVAHWEGENLVIESSREAQGIVLTQRDVWILSADKKTLTVQSHVKLPNGEFDVKQVFNSR